MKGSIFCSALLLAACGEDIKSAETNSESSIALGSLEQPIIYVDQSCTSYQAEIDLHEVYAVSVILAALPVASSNTGLYARYFGTWNSTRAATVQDVFDDVLANWGDFEVNCNDPTCQSNPSWAGYANADPDLFHLCAPWLGLESGTSAVYSTKTKTIDHEKVHVVSNVVDENDAACTVSGCYGAANARALANANATKAVNSADNYAYFAMEAYAITTILPSIAILSL